MKVWAMLACAAAATIVSTLSGPASDNPGSPAPVRPIPLSAQSRLAHHEFVGVPTSAQCRRALGVACYTPTQLQQAYDLPALYRNGHTGAGRTIAVVDSFGSPSIAADLHTFDAAMGLPDPPSIRTIAPAGPLPAFDPTDAEMTGWAYETTLDVEYAHAMAPGAAILVVATPVGETEGVQGFPQIMAAEQYVIRHGLADVISQSFAASEVSFPDQQSLLALRGAFVAAAAHDVTVVSAAGDTGPTAYELDQSTLSPTPTDSWPSSDPLVTSVGGTALHLAADGTRDGADSVWNDGYGAAGGGLSAVFPRPAFQSGVRSVVGDHRGTPDVAMSAGVDGGVLVYTSYDSADTGWSVVGGTSEAAPLFAGIVAIADQLADRRLGVLNGLLYRLAGERSSGLIDVRLGDNTFGGVTGFSAGPGYDLASGLGTVDAARFVPALVRLAQHRP